jgi:polysaccharide biosynthesis transport protein
MLNMENQPLEKHARGTLRPPRRQYMEMPFPEALEDPGPGLLLEYWQILQRRKGTLILMVLLGLVISLLFTLPQKPIYQARACIEILNLNDNFMNTRTVSPTADDGSSNPSGSALRTQARILESESLLDRVAAKLDLGKKLLLEEGSGLSAWRRDLGLEAGRQALTREQIRSLVAKNLKISTEVNTRLVEIRYDSTDPQLASDFVNTLTAEFVQQNFESHWKTTQQTGEWLTRQMEDVRIKLEKSDDELQKYAHASGLLFTSEKDNVAEEKLRELQEELSKAQSDRVASQSRYELVSTASPESLPEVLDDATLKEYQVKLTDLRRQLAEISSSLTPAHPAVKKVQAQVTTLESALDKERTNIIQRIRNEFAAAQRRERLLAGNYASQAHVISEQAAKVTHYNILKREVDTNRQLYDSMLQNVQQANMTAALGASNIRVVDSAQPPAHPYKPSLFSNSALGLLAGAFFGIALVVIQERADRTIRGPGNTAIYLDVPELGAIPSAEAEGSLFFAYYQNGKGLESENSENGKTLRVELVTSNKRNSPLAEAFRATLTSILYSEREIGDRPRVIVITSANPREGKTTIATNLALAFAEVGQSFRRPSALLIDGDIRRPQLHEIFGVPNQWGLSDLLEGKKGMFYQTRFRNLCLLPSGPLPSNVSTLLHSPLMFEFLKRTREEFHTIIIDTPPMLHMPDARILGRIADGVILVVRSAQTMMDVAVAANHRLHTDGTRVLGTILNQWDPRKTNKYSYGYSYDVRE